MQRYTVYFILKLLYMFRMLPSLIIRSANNCIYSIWYLSRRYCYLPLDRTPPDEWSARRKHLYLITHHSQETDLHAPAGFEPVIPACERPQTHALTRGTTGISCIIQVVTIISPYIYWRHVWPSCETVLRSCIYFLFSPKLDTVLSPWIN